MNKANEILDMQNNTNPFNRIAIINKETKKKPYDIKIKNNNPNEPKINVNMKYSDKQKYRRYKTKVEPKLFSKIMIDEEDDIVNTIKKAFGIEPEKKRNLTAVETSEMPYYQEPNPVQGEEPDIVEMYKEPEPEPEQEQAPAPAPAPAPKATRKERKPKPDDIELEPKTSSEMTGKLALPSPLTPSRIKELFSPTKEKVAARAEAAERRKGEEEAAKERLEALSTLSLEEKEKEINRKLKEREEELSKPLSVKDEETFQKHLKKEFRDLTEEKVQWLRKQYKISGNLPDPKYFGRTSEEIDKKLRKIEADGARGKGILSIK